MLLWNQFLCTQRSNVRRSVGKTAFVRFKFKGSMTDSEMRERLRSLSEDEHNKQWASHIALFLTTWPQDRLVYNFLYRNCSMSSFPIRGFVGYSMGSSQYHAWPISWIVSADGFMSQKMTSKICHAFRWAVWLHPNCGWFLWVSIA